MQLIHDKNAGSSCFSHVWGHKPPIYSPFNASSWKASFLALGAQRHARASPILIVYLNVGDSYARRSGSMQTPSWRACPLDRHCCGPWPRGCLELAQAQDIRALVKLIFASMFTHRLLFRHMLHTRSGEISLFIQHSNYFGSVRRSLGEGGGGGECLGRHGDDALLTRCMGLRVALLVIKA